MANLTATKAKPQAENGVWQSLWQIGLYKPSQGRIARQATGWILFGVAVLLAWRVTSLWGATEVQRYTVGAVIVMLGGWLSYRLVNVPRLADFLIAVEAEMHKVSWPTWSELVRNSIVVIVTMLVLAVLLYTFDVIWSFLFRAIGILG